MKSDFRNPIEAIAGPELARQFGDLLSSRAEMFDFEYGLVASMLGNIFRGQVGRQERERWERTVRAAHYYLDRGALKRTRESCESYVRIADAIPSALNDVMRKRDAADKLLGDEWIEALLALYKAITEGLRTLIASRGHERRYKSQAVDAHLVLTRARGPGAPHVALRRLRSIISQRGFSGLLQPVREKGAAGLPAVAGASLFEPSARGER